MALRDSTFEPRPHSWCAPEDSNLSSADLPVSRDAGFTDRWQEGSAYRNGRWPAHADAWRDLRDETIAATINLKDQAGSTADDVDVGNDARLPCALPQVRFQFESEQIALRQGAGCFSVVRRCHAHVLYCEFQQVACI